MLNYIQVSPGTATSDHVKKYTLLPSATSPNTISSYAYGEVSVAFLSLETTEEREDRLWDEITAQPYAQSALSRRAAQLRQNLAAGEYEEGGFAVE